MNERDPRIEPKKGDIVQLPRDFRQREIASVTDTVSLYGINRGRLVPMSYCSLAAWPRLARGAKVIRVAVD